MAVLMLVSVVLVRAQFTLRVAGGYAGPGLQNTENVLGPDIDPSTPQIDQLVNMANINDSTHTNKPIHGSYGTGGNVTLGVGYMFNRFIGFDIGLSYGHSTTMTATDYREIPLTPPAYINATINTYAYAVALAPSLVITGEKTGWKVYPYGRFGIVLPVVGKLTHDITITSPIALNQSPFWLGNVTDVKLETTGAMSLGFGSALGVAYKPFPFMNVFLEINGQYLQVKGKSSTITEWTATVYNANGGSTVVNDIPGRGTYRTEFNYVSQLTSSSNNAQYNANYNPKAPKEDLTPTSPGSNLGFNVGVTFFLSKKTLKKEKPAAKS